MDEPLAVTVFLDACGCLAWQASRVFTCASPFAVWRFTVGCPTDIFPVELQIFMAGKINASPGIQCGPVSRGGGWERTSESRKISRRRQWAHLFELSKGR